MAFHTKLRNPNGNCYVLYLYFSDGRWNWNYNWLDNDFNANNPSAVLATLFISPSPLAGRFVYPEFARGISVTVHSIHQAFCLFHLSLPKQRYTFYYPEILFPTKSSRVF